MPVAGEPFIPLFKGRIAPGIVQALAPVLDSGQLATGPQVQALEETLGHYLGSTACVATVDRAAALTLALRLCNVGTDSDVLLSPLACLATTMPVANLGARPVWCDVDPTTGMLDPDELKRRVTPRTRAILHYLWGGDTGPLEALQREAQALGLPLIVDASGGLGARLGERHIGATGADFTVLSFYAVSHLPAGDGGALVCREARHAGAARELRRFGIHKDTFRLANGDLNPDSDIPIPGYSFAMTDVTAALALAQWPLLEDTVARHQANGEQLDVALADISHCMLLRRQPDEHSAYWVYALRAKNRDAMQVHLRANGIGSQRLHVRNDRYSCFPPNPAKLAGVDEFDAENIALPCGWWVDDEARARIVRCLRDIE